MADRPTLLPEWASSNITETVDGFDYLNKEEPSQGLKNSGLLHKQGLSRPNFNYQMDLIDEWLNFFDSNYSVLGSVILIDPAVNGSYVPPNGWVADGTQAIGNTTYDCYERTT